MRLIPFLLIVAACAYPGVPGIYQAAAKAPERDDGERFVIVNLKADGGAAVTSGLSARSSRSIAEGTWRLDGRRIVVELPGRKPLVFEPGLDQLVTREWDSAAYGERLDLFRRLR